MKPDSQELPGRAAPPAQARPPASAVSRRDGFTVTLARIFPALK